MTLQQSALRFALVALLLAAGASLGQTTPDRKSEPAKPLPVITVEASYPGSLTAGATGVDGACERW
jgi:hypothetical protein